ncbi:MAG: hypothetical protein GY938_04235, partial [Ketobacter sp.]|nr:hypothetical protein [Ketobacter sp.]
MGIRTKRAPRQLDDEIVETVWPGDSAVDLEQSDLVAWCRGSGSAGLVMAGTEKPDLIKWRALSDQALSHVMRSIMAESPNAMDEAFRY